MIQFRARQTCLIIFATMLLSCTRTATAIDPGDFVADQISKQVSRQIGDSISGSIYGRLVPLSLEIENTAGRLAHARYLRAEGLYLQQFKGGALLVWDFRQGHQILETSIPRRSRVLYFDRADASVYLQAKSGEVLQQIGSQRINLNSDAVPPRVQQELARSPEAAKTGKTSAFSYTLKGDTLYLTPGGRVSNDVAYAAIVDDQHFIYAREDGSTYFRRAGLQHYLVSIVPGESGWIVVDHEGRYDGTVAGTRDVHWKAGKDKLDLDQFFEQYYQPGLLASYMEGGTTTLGVVPADVKNGVFLPPKVDLDTPQAQMKIGEVFRIVVVAESQGGLLQRDLQMFHNGKRLPEKSMVGSQVVQNEEKHLVVGVFSITPTPGANEVYAVAKNEQGISARSSVERQVTKGYQAGGALHVVGLGVDEYRNRDLNLSYAVADTDALQQSFRELGRSTYDKVQLQRMVNKQATLRNARQTLALLANAAPSDSIVLSLAGHGVSHRGEWYFLPHDAKLRDLPGTAISAKMLQDALVSSPAQRIMLLIDACYSGGGIDSFNRYKNFQRRFVQSLGRNAGIAVVTAARRDQTALEAQNIGHGLFTYTLIEGLSGKADDSPRDGNVSAHEVAKYVSEQMKLNGLELVYGMRGQPSRKLAEQLVQQDPSHFVIGSDFVLGKR